MAIKHHSTRDAGWEKDRQRRKPCNHSEGGMNGDRAKQGIDAEECLENVTGEE